MSEWKEAEFGNIPLDWELKKIIDLKSSEKSAIAMGPFGSNIKAENFVSDGVPVIRGTNLNFDKYVGGNFVFLNQEKADELKGSNCKPGDLVFTHRGTIGQVGMIPKGKYSRYVISQSGMKLTVDDTKISNEFLFYFFKSGAGQYQLLKNEAQVGVPSISNPLTTLKELEVPVPKLSEQTAIVSILSSLDDKIDLLHRQNKTLEQLAETLFRQWFVAGALNWQGSLSEYVKVHGGYAFKSKDFKESGFAGVIKITNISMGSVDIENSDFVDADAVQNLDKRFKINSGDFLIAMTGAEIGKIGIVEKTGKEIWLNQRVGKLEAKVPYGNIIGYLALKSREGQYHIINTCSGSAQENISTTGIEQVPFAPYDSVKSNLFGQQAQSLFSKVIFNLYQIQSLVRLRDTLLPKLVSGEARVKMN